MSKKKKQSQTSRLMLWATTNDHQIIKQMAKESGLKMYDILHLMIEQYKNKKIKIEITFVEEE